jgi:hypothetical protein
VPRWTGILLVHWGLATVLALDQHNGQRTVVFHGLEGSATVAPASCPCIGEPRCAGVMPICSRIAGGSVELPGPGARNVPHTYNITAKNGFVRARVRRRRQILKRGLELKSVTKFYFDNCAAMFAAV